MHHVRPIRVLQRRVSFAHFSPAGRTLHSFATRALLCVWLQCLPGQASISFSTTRIELSPAPAPPPLFPAPTRLSPTSHLPEGTRRLSFIPPPAVCSLANSVRSAYHRYVSFENSYQLNTLIGNSRPALRQINWWITETVTNLRQRSRSSQPSSLLGRQEARTERSLIRSESVQGDQLLSGPSRAIGDGGGRSELLYKQVLPLLPEILVSHSVASIL
ncbi:hypothetical protein LXA43DRAFT_1096108 [Ganoderma leucocontextum]|nr:hypothetical protein LXA43DRAFT_1096108 [Ganoderma leucocontextum]